MEKPMRISATQIKAFACPRKWALERIWGLSLPMGDAFAWGSILHRIMERWLKANDNGRDNAGNPVDPFAGKWWVWEERGTFFAMDAADQELVRTLFTKAVSQGIIKRTPGRMIETWIKMQVIPGVEMVGKVDNLNYKFGIVEDHKTSSKKRYALSEAALRKDIQMMSYAKYLIDEVPGLDYVRLKHNYFIKDHKNPEVFERSVLVPRDEVEAFWQDEIIPIVKQMLEVEKQIKVEKKTWEEIPRTGALCNAYGGCAFQRLCAGSETFEGCKVRLERMGKKILEQMEAKKMGIFDKIKKDNEVKDAEVKEEAETATPEVPAQQGEAPTPQAPPEWAQPGCKACEGTGYNSKGKPCRICQQVYKIRGKATPPSSPPSPPQPKADAPQVTNYEKPTEAPTPPKKRGRGRPRKEETASKEKKEKKESNKFTLYINCVPTKGKKGEMLDVLIEEIMMDAKAENEEKFKALDFYQKRELVINALRRDMYEIPTHLIGRENTPLQKAVLAFLRSRAKVVVEALQN